MILSWVNKFQVVVTCQHKRLATLLLFGKANKPINVDIIRTFDFKRRINIYGIKPKSEIEKRNFRS